MRQGLFNIAYRKKVRYGIGIPKQSAIFRYSVFRGAIFVFGGNSKFDRNNIANIVVEVRYFIAIKYVIVEVRYFLVRYIYSLKCDILSQ